MNLAQLRRLYDSEVRARPVGGVGLTVERCGGVVRLTGAYNFVSFSTLTAETVRAAVQAQAAHFNARGEDVSWRVYDYDQPTDLSLVLAENGFQSDEPGTLMVFDLKSELRVEPTPRVEVRRVRCEADLDDFVRASDVAFDDQVATQRRSAYAERLNDPDLALFVAYIDGEAAASARVEMNPGCSFGLLFGGGVMPAHRRRGLYRALVAARVAEAQRRGLAYLSTDALMTSRPILERMGFIPVAGEETWVLTQ